MTKPAESQHKKLWNEFRSGSDEAFASLYSAYAGKLYDYGLHFTDDVEMVKDCVQDLFAKLYVGQKKLGEVENVKVYMLIAMKNTLFNLFKKEMNHYNIDSIEPVFDTEFSAEAKMIESEEILAGKKRIERMMEIITPRQREVLYYRFIEELSYEEICGIMRMNYQSVRNLLHRTIGKIREAAANEK